VATTKQPDWALQDTTGTPVTAENYKSLTLLASPTGVHIYNKLNDLFRINVPHLTNESQQFPR
jgi:hypothetical protein